jgi:hypothetical protein
MTRTRIVVPATAAELSVPHFDDEATIITARPVVPIARARAGERSRLLLWMLPIVLAAAVCGALSALGVNYYENRHSPVTQVEIKAEPQMNQPPAPELQSVAPPIGSEVPGGAVATESATPESERPQTEAAVADQKESLSADKDRTSITSSNEPSSLPAAKPSPPGASDYRKNGSSNDPGRLVRKRRVYPVTEASPPESRVSRKNRGAGRIQDIFEGPNHQ